MIRRWHTEIPIFGFPEFFRCGGHFENARGDAFFYGPLARYVKLLVAHAPRMPGMFSPPLWVSDPDTYHDKCVQLERKWKSSHTNKQQQRPIIRTSGTGKNLSRHKWNRKQCRLWRHGPQGRRQWQPANPKNKWSSREEHTNQEQTAPQPDQQNTR